MRGIVLADDTHLSAAMVGGQPLICYSIATLLRARIKAILVVAPPAGLARLQHLLGDGARWGIGLSYAMLPASAAPAQRPLQALRLAAEFIGGQRAAALAANEILHGGALTSQLPHAAMLTKGALLLCRRMDAARVGEDDARADFDRVRFDQNGKATAIARGTGEVHDANEMHEANDMRDAHETHDANETHDAQSIGATIGLRFYDASVAARARALPDDAALADLHQHYLDDGALRVAMLRDQTARLRVADADALTVADASLRAAERRAGAKPCCADEIAWRAGLIDDRRLLALADAADDDYARYLRRLVETEA
ncbi:MAG: sugar phosphate nucleotidyltransferase [bacterium]